MLERDAIEKRLKGVDPQLCVAFAARCSFRVMPLLVRDQSKEAFWYWENENRSKYIFALFRAQQFGINYSVFSEINNDAVAIATAARAPAFADAADAAAAYTADAATAAARASAAAKAYAASTACTVSTAAACTASASASSAVYASAACAASTSAAPFRLTNIDVEAEILFDLDAIVKKISCADFVYSPLWFDTYPTEWHVLYTHFNEAIIDLHAGFEIWAKWYQDRVNLVPLDQEQEQNWLNIPVEVKEQGVNASNAYLTSLECSQPLNLVRAIFIGNGAAGKTSLIRKLHDEPIVAGEEKMTPGIEIREWPVPKTEIKARFWDFGGQVMSHSTHQFFLRERCLYILLLDARTEINANDQAEYWLEHVKAFGNAAPVMLVGNKSDLTAVNLDMNALREKYKNIIGFYEISCTSKASRFQHLYALFRVT